MAPPSICCTLVAALICCPINDVDSLSRPGSSVSSRRRGLVDTSEVPVLRSTCIANRSGGLPRCTDIKTRSIPSTDEEVDQSMEHQASLIRHRLDTAKTTTVVSD
eukprot:scaffold1646_cov88-Alexandrium_tamarense.AAC.1